MVYAICIPAGIILILFTLYILALRPNGGRQSLMKPYTDTYIAHRGLFNNKDIPENSIPAFAKAVKEGYGIELDVQLTSDRKLVVFHDESLKRMCGDERILHKTSYDELCKLSLLGTDEKIPLFSDVLMLIGGAVPLIVEIKSEGDYLATTQMTNDMLTKYGGEYCVESFHPSVIKWYRKNNPQVIRGQLSTKYKKDAADQPWYVRFILTNLLLNYQAKPDFIAYNHVYKRQFSYRLCRGLYKPVNVAWTIRSQDELDSAKDVFSVIIFDSFIPKRPEDA